MTQKQKFGNEALKVLIEKKAAHVVYGLRPLGKSTRYFTPVAMDSKTLNKLSKKWAAKKIFVYAVHANTIQEV